MRANLIGVARPAARPGLGVVLVFLSIATQSPIYQFLGLFSNPISRTNQTPAIGIKFLLSRISMLKTAYKNKPNTTVRNPKTNEPAIDKQAETKTHPMPVEAHCPSLSLRSRSSADRTERLPESPSWDRVRLASSSRSLRCLIRLSFSRLSRARKLQPSQNSEPGSRRFPELHDWQV